METDVNQNQPSSSTMADIVNVSTGESVDKQLQSSDIPAGTTITVVDASQTSDLGGLLQASEMMEIITQEVTTLAQANGAVGEAITTVAPIMSQNGVVLQASELMKQIMEQVNIKQEDGEDAPQTVYAEIRPPDQMMIEDPTSGQDKQGGGLVNTYAMYDEEEESDSHEMVHQQSDNMGGSTKVLHVQATQEPVEGDPNSVEASRTLTVVITNFPDHLKTQILSYSCMSCGSAFNEVVDLMSHVCTGTAPLIANASSVVINTGMGTNTDIDPNKTVISTADLYYRCDECPKKFVKKHELVRHKNAHKKGESARGREEDWDVTRSEVGPGYESHYQLKHELVNRVELMTPTEEEDDLVDQNIITTENGQYQCAVCLKCCKRKFDLKRHLLTHSNIRERPHNCPHCDKRFLTASHLRQHLRAHAGIKPFECEECGKTFARSSEVTRHKVVHQRGGVAGNSIENSVEEDQDAIPVSVVSAMGSLSYECTDCAETFLNKKDLQLHLFEKHTFQCKQCATVFPTLGSLERHMAEHREEVYTCIECSMVFVHKKQLKQHNKQKHREKRHGESSSRHGHKHRCDGCGKEFRKSSNLKRHMVTHTDRERRHQCELCEKRFLTSSHLKAHHMQKHSEERPNQCAFCEKKFARKHDLKRHMAVHDADRERPYECEHCQKRYITASHLRDHQVVHTGIKVL
ncbi:zinc finger protein 708 isoform X1 [Strongylocentrotus purpuratus]|uniref:C2H2-type domain-containing protein n=1 Tax=Strongylocentrotus purpuratus TaxID=7668 RepID=A0A7M7NC59_STRPU|nr:zinc finger protein 708 isoform X1 [Strongylocentrotus purpuratus]|eukprot:XP_011666772.1 PREDICTED: zinc finger protein 708 isoform X1 [Strongylocentrotus purpuratus]